MAHRRIDVHQHLVPQPYADWLRTKGIAEAGGRELPTWSADEALRVMDAHEIASAVLSISTPGVHLDPTRTVCTVARDMARRVNEEAASVAQRHPGRFGFFATLTLPDVDGALEEAAYALDTLGASGVVLLANTHGAYLGAPEHEPLLAELARRETVVLVHPSTLPAPAVDGIPPFAADFLLDTTRAAFRLVRAGVPRRLPALKIVLAHAGGFVPYASHRLAAALAAETGRSPLEILDDFADFFFDTALSSSPAALPTLLAFAKPGHVLFGSDWPFAPEIAVSWFAGSLDAYPLDDATRAAIDRGNAAALFPRLA